MECLFGLAAFAAVIYGLYKLRNVSKNLVTAFILFVLVMIIGIVSALLTGRAN